MAAGALPTMVQSLGKYDIFLGLGLFAPTVIGMAFAVLGGILLTLLGSVTQGSKSEEERQEQVKGVVNSENAKQLDNAFKDAVQDIVKAADIPELLQILDDLKAKEFEADVFKNVEKIFNHFDEDKNGILEGDEVTKCVDALAEHVKKEFERELPKVVREALQKRGKDDPETIAKQIGVHASKFNMSTLKRHILRLVDSDSDGKITKDEALKGFKMVVDYID